MKELHIYLLRQQTYGIDADIYVYKIIVVIIY